MKKIFSLIINFILIYSLSPHAYANSTFTSSIYYQDHNTKSFEYTDNDANVKFIVPRNWKQESFCDKKETLDVKFVSTKYPSYMIMYGSTDVWGQLSPSEKANCSRTDYNNTLLTAEQLASAYSVSTDNVSTDIYNGFEYYKIQYKGNYNIDGHTITSTMTIFIRIENGWAYSFQFTGTASNILYSDFESILESVHYLTPRNTLTSTSTGSTLSGIPSHIGLLLPITLIAVIVFIKRRKNTKHTIVPSQSPPTPPVTDESSKFVICPNCNSNLPSDSKFCHLCGNQITKEHSI